MHNDCSANQSGGCYDQQPPATRDAITIAAELVRDVDCKHRPLACEAARKLKDVSELVRFELKALGGIKTLMEAVRGGRASAATVQIPIFLDELRWAIVEEMDSRDELYAGARAEREQYRSAGAEMYRMVMCNTGREISYADAIEAIDEEADRFQGDDSEQPNAMDNRPAPEDVDSRATAASGSGSWDAMERLPKHKTGILDEVQYGGKVSIPLTLLRRLVDAIETTHCDGDGDEYNIDENCDLQKEAEKYLH